MPEGEVVFEIQLSMTTWHSTKCITKKVYKIDEDEAIQYYCEKVDKAKRDGYEVIER